MRRAIELTLTSDLAAPAPEVWAHASSMAGVNDELRPWVRMTHPADATDLASVDVPLGEVIIHSWLLAFGVVPFDRHALGLDEVHDDGAAGGAFVEESTSWLQRRWRHERTVVARGSGCVVTDRLVVQPRAPVGRLVRPVIAALFRHRHRRLVQRFGGAGAPVRSPRGGRPGTAERTGGAV